MRIKQAESIAVRTEMPHDKLLTSITDASASNVTGRQNIRHVYGRMLDDLLEITQSHYGFIGQVEYIEGTPQIREYALTCSGWDGAAQAKYEAEFDGSELLDVLDPLFSHPLLSQDRTISNKAGERPGQFSPLPGHPAVQTFLGIPVFSGLELVAVIGLANRWEGYTDAIAKFLAPLVSTCANVTVAWRLESSRRKVSNDLDTTRCLMRTMVDRAPSAVLYENADRKLEFINARFAGMFGIEASPSQVVGIDSALVMKHSKKLFADPEQFINRIENLIEGQESCYGEEIQMANGRQYLRDFVIVRSGLAISGYFWHYREPSTQFDD